MSNGEGNGNPGSEEQSGIATVTRTELAAPKMYKVLMHNDDYTTMEFVIHVLTKFFQKNQEQK